MIVRDHRLADASSSNDVNGGEPPFQNFFALCLADSGGEAYIATHATNRTSTPSLTCTPLALVSTRSCRKSPEMSTAELVHPILCPYHRIVAL